MICTACSLVWAMFRLDPILNTRYLSPATFEKVTYYHLFYGADLFPYEGDLEMSLWLGAGSRVCCPYLL